MGTHIAQFYSANTRQAERKARLSAQDTIPRVGHHGSMPPTSATQGEAVTLASLMANTTPGGKHRGGRTENTITRDKRALANPYGPSPYGAHRGISTFANQARETQEITRVYWAMMASDIRARMAA